MAKPVIQIEIKGPQGSGKTSLTELITSELTQVYGYAMTTPASSYDDHNSCQLENEFHIIQIREKQTFSKNNRCDLCASAVNQEKEVSNG